MDNIFLSVVIPAYKEESRIGDTLLSLEDYFKDKPYQYEIIVVNDGSPDNTAKVVKGYMQKVKNLRLVDNKENHGKGFAVNCGMAQAKGEYRLFMDADNSVHISTVENFLPELKIGADVVIGSIRLKKASVSENSGWYRRALGYIAKVIIGVLAVPGISDTQRGFKLFSRKASEVIFPLQTINRFGFDIELLVIAWVNGLKIKELPVVWNNADGSTVTLKSYFQTLRELFHIVRNRLSGRYTFSAVNMKKINI